MEKEKTKCGCGCGCDYERTTYEKTNDLSCNNTRIKKDIKRRLEEIRETIKDESISYGEITELQGFEKFIDKDDVKLLQWIGVSES